MTPDQVHLICTRLRISDQRVITFYETHSSSISSLVALEFSLSGNAVRRKTQLSDQHPSAKPQGSIYFLDSFGVFQSTVRGIVSPNIRLPLRTTKGQMSDKSSSAVEPATRARHQTSPKTR
ncbi:Hypothetical_protein [Hexamita inflata]|uniref:Hypothetical_protein n=1 Tax=Hexamita inflata TaxID=28002 RepID=A0AA86UPZ9_9EUKA|nr:Hypothetical protein HINF_LOCUS54735 [Hexamita inflata]